MKCDCLSRKEISGVNDHTSKSLERDTAAVTIVVGILEFQRSQFVNASNKIKEGLYNSKDHHMATF